jgi:hypothetical protein
MIGGIMHCGYCGRATHNCTCGSVAMQAASPPAVVQPAPEPPPPVARPRYVQFGGYEVCARCNYAREFCGCDKKPPPPPTHGDGIDSSLNKRVRELRRGRT